VADITTKTVNCAGGLPAFLAMPASTGRSKIPAIVLMHERYGLVKHTCDLTERFARDGFVCIAPDFFYKHPDQEALHRGDAGYALKDVEAIDYLDSAVAELSALPQVDAARIAIKGVCQTGRHPLVLAAERRNIGAALVWYGAANAREWEPNDRYAKPFDDMLASVQCPVLGIFGEADHLISLADVRRFRDSLDRHDKTYTIRVFAGAPHGWLNDTMPGRYRRDAAEAAWDLQLAFLRRVFDPAYDKTRRIQVYESEHAADYDFKKNVRME
jgi:carboxymethylenebutenolidase